MRPRSLTTRRRVARIARPRLAGRTRPLPPATRHMQSARRARALARIATLLTARAGGGSTVRAPLIQPGAVIAHGRSPALTPRAWSPVFETEGFGVERVHSASARFSSNGFTASQPYKLISGRLQVFSARSLAAVNARDAVNFPL